MGRRRRLAATTAALALASPFMAVPWAAAARNEREPSSDGELPRHRPSPRLPPRSASRTALGADAAARQTPAVGISETRRVQASEEGATMEGSCSGSALEAGQQKGRGAYLCYPAVDPIYKFGIDSASRLAFYYTSTNGDKLLWHAAPSPPDTPACVVFGECFQPMQFFRMRASGDLVGFSPDRTRAWESHGEDEMGAGEWSAWAAELGMDGGDARQSEMRPGSTLEVTDAGVLIRDGDVVTWKLDAPPKLDTTAPTAAPTKRAATNPPTGKPTDEPTVPPTPNAEVVSVSGTLFFDSNNDGLVDDTDPDRPPDALAAEAAATAAGVLHQIVVDLYDCATDEWILITRASAGASANGSNGDPNGAAATTAEYQFTIPLPGGGTTTNLSPRLSELGVNSIRAEFALPSAAMGAFEFVPPGKDSDVDPATGRTGCWDLDVDGRGEIAWNAGIRTVGADDAEKAPTSKPTMRPAPAIDGEAAPAPTGGIVGGYAFLDLNDDGVRDLGNPSSATAEPALADVEVRLFSCPSATGAASFAATTESGKGREALLGVQRTDDRGFYSFRNLFSGSYRVRAVPPPGHEISAAWKGGGSDSGSGVDNAVDPASGATDCFSLEGGVTDLRWDVGLAPLEESAAPAESPVEEQAPAAIAGFVFDDANNNGYLDDGEAALPGVRVALADCDGAVIKVANTDPNGMYGFASVPPGSYELRFSLDGHRPSDVWTGLLDEEGKLIAEDTQNDANPDTGSTACAEYGPGTTVLDVDAGLISIPEGEATSPVVATVSPIGLQDGAPSTKPSVKPTVDPKGDGTACSGAACPVEGMCRNKAGLCGAGIGFCNPSAVWDAGCPEKAEPAEGPPLTAEPTAPVTVAPALSANPTQSPAPTPITAVATPGTNTSLPDEPLCHPDGSYGVALGTSSPIASAGEGAATAVEVAFTYALQSDDGAAPGPELVARFERQLNDRLACAYFDDACLSCEGSGGGRLRGRRRNREAGSVLGLSSLPKDLLNLFEVCSGGAAADDCRVIDGKFTAYYPARMTPRELLEANNEMLKAVERELAADDWDGLRASYGNAPFPASVAKEGDTGDEDGGGGTSAGAIVGIVIAVLVLVALAAAGVVLFVRRKREKDEEEFAAQRQHRAVPFGDSGSLASQGNDSDDDSDSDDESSSGSSSSSSSSGDSSSSESEETDSFRDSKGAATALSGDTYPTNVAQARSADIEDDASDSYSGSDDGGSYDEQQSEVLAGQLSSVANDENAGAYDDEGGGYNGGQNDDNYAAEGGQAYTTPGNYTGQAQDEGYDDGRPLPDTDDAGSMFSDPPGTSYRDLPQEEEWDHAVAAPVQEQYPLQRTNQGDSSGSFRVYENEAGMSDSYHSFNNQAADGSYHSQHSGRSFHSQRSARSNHSRHSHEEAQYSSQVHPQQQAYDDGAQYGDFRQQASFHSTHSHHSKTDDAQSNPGSYHSEHSGRSFHSQRSHHSRHSPEEMRQHEGEMRQHEGGDGVQYSGQENEGPHYGQEYPYMDDGGNEAAYGGHHGGGTNYDEESYHSFNPISAPARPEELDEVSHTGSATTRQVSNKSSPMQQPTQSARPGHEAMGEEESINRIFNSLSDIQSRLASKGEHGQWMEPVDEAHGS